MASGQGKERDSTNGSGTGWPGAGYDPKNANPWGIPPAPFTLSPYQPRGPWGITPDVSQFMSPNWANIAAFGQRTPQEMQALNSVSGLARLISGQGSNLYNVGSPAYQQALAYYQRLLGGDHAAITEAVAPEGEALAEVYKGAGKSLEAGPLRGGARDLATAELGRQKAGQIAAIAPAARQAAASQAGQLGLAGATAGTSAEQAGAGLYNQVVGSEQQNRQAAQTQSLNQQNLGLQASLGAAKLTLDDLVQSGQLGVAEYRAMTEGQLGAGRLTLDQYLGQGNLSLRQQELAQRIKEYQAQQQQAQAGIWGKILGSLLPFLKSGGGAPGGPGGGSSPGGAGAGGYGYGYGDTFNWDTGTDYQTPYYGPGTDQDYPTPYGY